MGVTMKVICPECGFRVEMFPGKHTMYWHGCCGSCGQIVIHKIKAKKVSQVTRLLPKHVKTGKVKKAKK